MKRLFVVLAASLAIMLGLAGSASAAVQFTQLQSGFTQELYATGQNFDFFTGIAFAPDADVWVVSCGLPGASSLDRYDNSTTTLVNGTSVHPFVPPSPSLPDRGCGLTNRPGPYMYANSVAGVVEIDATTGVWTRKFGAPGNALGITTDPVTGNLVYVGSDGEILTTPLGGPSSIFSSATFGGSCNFACIDGIAFDPTGKFLFNADHDHNLVLIMNRSGQIVQTIPNPGGPDGISFHANSPKFVVINNNDGTITRLDFPNDDYTQPPTVSVPPFASGGFRGDLTQVGPDGCIYVTQVETRFDSGAIDPQNSVVRICPGFAPQPAGKILTYGGSMEGALKILPGSWVNGGVHLKLSRKNATAVMGTVTGNILLPVHCGGPNGPLAFPVSTITVPVSMPFTIAPNSTDWIATADQNSIDAWLGAVQAQPLCGIGMPMYNSEGAKLDVTINSGAHTGVFTVQWHYRIPAAKNKPNTNCTDALDANRNRAGVCGASWSATKDP